MISTVLLMQLALGSRLEGPVADRVDLLARQALQQGGQPRGAAPLIRLRSLLDEVDDLSLLAEPLSALAFRFSTHPQVRVLARLFLADVERSRGRTLKAQELVSDTGYVQDWYAVGGFDNEGKRGCDTNFGPETKLDLSEAYPLRDREVGWRTIGARASSGFVDLSRVVRPSSGVVAYALTFLQVDAESRITLALGASGASRLYVNGVGVLVSNQYNEARPEQRLVQVTLRKGTNRVLLKLCQEHGALGFYFRAERSEGLGTGPRAVLPPSIPPLEPGPGPQPQLQPGLSQLLAAEVQRSPSDALLRADYATVLHHTRAFDEREHAAAIEARKAAAQRPGDAELLLRAAHHQDEDLNLRRRLVEQALALEPRSPFGRLALAELELAQDHPERASALAETLALEFPGFGPAVLARVRALEALGERMAALRVTEDAFRRLPWLPGIAREAIARARRMDRPDEAIARARMALALRYDDTDTRRALVSMLSDSGQAQAAAEQLRKVLTLDPFDVASALRLGELLTSNGSPDEARGAFADVKRLAPDDPEVHEAEGRVLLQWGQHDEALRAFQWALKLKPQHSALKEMVRTLRGEDDATSPYALAVARDAAQPWDGGLEPEDAIILAQVTAVRVHPSGQASRFSQLAVQVMNQRGVEHFRQHGITWSPNRDEVRVLKARVTKPDGSIVDSFGDQDQALNEPWTGMYYDSRARVLTFPALAPGDTLELQWRVDDTAVENLLSDYWGDLDFVQGPYPKRQYLYVVDMPQARALQWNRTTLPAWVSTEQTTRDGRTLTFFRARDVPKRVTEPMQPGASEVYTPLHLSTYRSWDDVGRYYWGLVRDQLTPNEELRAQAAALLRGVDRKNVARVVAAVYGFVVTNTRYVALEFGIHGYKPYRVDQVLARRFGDCKDKAALIYSLLQVAGVDSRLVLLRMRSLGALPPEPASLAAFNHAIVYVPSLDRYLDGTAEFHGSRELPSADRLANVLVVEPDGGSRFLATPEAALDDNLSTMSLDFTLAGDGSAAVKGQLVANGQAAPELRRTFETAATRKANFEQQFAPAYPGLVTSEVSVSDPKALEQPATLSFKMRVPRIAEVGAEGLKFFPFGAPRTYTQSFASLTERTADLVLPGVWANRYHCVWNLPAGFTPGELPADVNRESPFGALRITVKKDGARLIVDGGLTVPISRIAAKDYAAFRAWLLEVDQLFGRKLQVRLGQKSAQR